MGMGTGLISRRRRTTSESGIQDTVVGIETERTAPLKRSGFSKLFITTFAVGVT